MNDIDVTAIGRWPPYPLAFADLDYALRADGWLTEFHGKPHNRCDVVLLDGEVIGFTLLLVAHGDAAEYRIALRADRLGQGYGETVSRMVLRRAFEEMGLSRIHLVVRKTNPRARRVYEKLGFRAIRECTLNVQGKPVEFVEMDICQQVRKSQSEQGGVTC